MGFRVLLLDTKIYNPNHYICIAIQQSLKMMSNVECVIKADLNDAISLSVKNKCNLFFAFDGEQLDRLICSRIHAVCGFSVLWVTEDPYELSVNISNANLFDLVFTNDSSCVESYGQKGRHLPLAGAKPFHFLHLQKLQEEIRYDMFFAGTAWPNRIELLKKVLATDLGGDAFKLKIAVPTNEHLPPVDLNLPVSQFNWRTSPVDFARFANKSLSTLVLPRVFSASGNRDFAETPPPRLYEAALSGTVQLVHSKLVETEKYFEVERDFLYFDTADDLVKLVYALRSDFTWRNQIAQNAQEKALAQHCYEHRMDYLLKEVTALKTQKQNTIEFKEIAIPKKIKILFVTHSILAHGYFGGVEVYLNYITPILSNEFEIYFYVPNRLKDENEIVVMDSQNKTLMQHNFSSTLSPWQLACQEREGAFSLTLTTLGISLVHFHHLMGHVPSMVEIARSLGTKVVMTFHDYYAICRNFNLLSFKKTYCHPDKISLSQCDICLSKDYHVLPGTQATRRGYWNFILAAIDTIIFNTQGSYNLAAQIYPALEKERNGIVLPIPMVPIQGNRESYNSKSDFLKIAILGNFSWQKGADIITNVIPLFKNSAIEFHIFGRIDKQYAASNDFKENPFVHVHGPYKPGHLPPEVYSCHVSLHLSIWPETYCLALSEAWACGLVPVVSDIGALGERVIDGVNGLKIPSDSEEALVHVLRRLLETPTLLEELRQNVLKVSAVSAESHIASLGGIYRTINATLQTTIENGHFVKKVNLAELGRNVVPVFESFENKNRFDEIKSIFIFIKNIAKLVILGCKYFRRYGLRSTFQKVISYIARRI